MPTKEVKHRRGTTAQHAAFRGAEGELTYNTETKRLHSHDGSTLGGFPHMLESEGLKKGNNLSDLLSASAARGSLDVLSRTDCYGIAKNRQFGNGLFFYGNTVAHVSTLSGYSIGTTEFTTRIIFRVPLSAYAMTLFFFGSSNTAPAANSFAVLLNSAGALEIRLYGASTSDYSSQTIDGFVTTYAGALVELVVVRKYSGLAVYVNGSAASLSSTVSVGTAPGFAATITSTYLVVGHGIASTNSLYGEVMAMSVFDFGMVAADVTSLVANGIYTTDLFSDRAELITSSDDRDFGGTPNWANSTMSAYNETSDLSLTSTASGQKCALAAANFSAPSTFFRYCIVCDVANLSGTFSFYSSSLGLLGTMTANGKFAVCFVPTGSFGDLEIRANGSGSVDIDNISFKRVGVVVDLDFAQASRYFVPDRSPNNFHAFGGGGILPAYATWTQRRGQVRGRTNTNGNQQLLGGTVLGSNYRISAIVINSDNSGVATTSVDIGTASGGAQIASAVTIASGRNEVATFVSRYTAGSIWIKANGSSNLDITILYDIVD